MIMMGRSRRRRMIRAGVSRRRLTWLTRATLQSFGTPSPPSQVSCTPPLKNRMQPELLWVVFSSVLPTLVHSSGSWAPNKNNKIGQQPTYYKWSVDYANTNEETNLGLCMRQKKLWLLDTTGTFLLASSKVVSSHSSIFLLVVWLTIRLIVFVLLLPPRLVINLILHT
jgi:hypothetical protein